MNTVIKSAKFTYAERIALEEILKLQTEMNNKPSNNSHTTTPQINQYHAIDHTYSKIEQGSNQINKVTFNMINGRNSQNEDAAISDIGTKINLHKKKTQGDKQHDISKQTYNENYRTQASETSKNIQFQPKVQNHEINRMQTNQATQLEDEEVAELTKSLVEKEKFLQKCRSDFQSIEFFDCIENELRQIEHRNKLLTGKISVPKKRYIHNYENEMQNNEVNQTVKSTNSIKRNERMATALTERNVQIFTESNYNNQNRI